MQTVKATRAGSTKVMSLSVQSDMFNRITEYCSVRGCSRTWFMNKAAEMFLNECLEDKADYETAVAAYERFEKSGEKGISLDDLREKLGV
jgi:hypothetical protein